MYDSINASPWSARLISLSDAFKSQLAWSGMTTGPEMDPKCVNFGKKSDAGVLQQHDPAVA